MDSSSAIPLPNTVGIDTSSLAVLSGHAWAIVLLLFLLLCSAFFSGAETVVTGANRIRLKTLADEKDRRAKTALGILDRFEKALTTILVGNTLVNIAIASIATLLANHIWSETPMAVPIATTVATLTVILFGEILPKTLAKHNADALSLGFASFLDFLIRVMTPVTAIFTLISKGASKLFGKSEEVTVTEDELYDIIETMEEEGSLEDDESKLIYSAFEFGDLTVGDVYTDRSDIQSVCLSDATEAIVEKIRKTKHSRLPVYEKTHNRIVGVIGIRKYLKAYLEDPHKATLASLMDKPFFVKSDAKISDLLSEMSGKGIHMAIVRDSGTGVLLGLVTVEDLLEELVGEIWDEDDNIDEEFKKIGGNRFEVSADLSMVSVFELIEYDNFDREECGHETVGKWLAAKLGETPLRTGVRAEYREIIFSVGKIAGGKIKSVIVRKKPSAVLREEQKEENE